MHQLPPRYEAVSSLGRGGGGEVWHVRDRVTGRDLALKILSHDAKEAELSALVREASALSGLMGLGLPAIDSFGALADGRRYLVRELVAGQSLEGVLADKNGADWILPLAAACVQLASIHRAGFFHGDIKPANIIVTRASGASLVDLGLIAPWRDGGTLARGLTPAFAAPELREGGGLSVRSEVYALGATLREALRTRGQGELSAEKLAALQVIADRALAKDPSLRFPSVAEFESALRVAAGLPPGEASFEPPWPIVGADTAAAVIRLFRGLAPHGLLVLDGPRGSGKTSLLARVAWTLGIGGQGLLRVEPHVATDKGALLREIVAARNDGRSLLLVDDVSLLDSASRDEMAQSIREGARAIVVGSQEDAAAFGVDISVFKVPPLSSREAEALVKAAIPSLPPIVVVDVVSRASGRPGHLRALVREIAKHTVVSCADLSDLLDRSSDALLRVAEAVSPSSHGPGTPVSTPPPAEAEPVAAAERAFLMGRVAEADALVRGDISPTSRSVTARLGVLRSRIALAQGDLDRADSELCAVQEVAEATGHKRAFQVASARLLLRRGQYEQARSVAGLASLSDDSLSVEGLAVVGVASAFTGDDVNAREALRRAVNLAEASSDDRAIAIAYGSLAIADVYSGKTADARSNYERSLEAASRARDAATVATTHLNLAALVQGAGDLAEALRHLEAAVDMARRAGVVSTLQQALLNLANLDLYLGRYARADASISALESEGGQLSGAARAQLMSLRAERTVRTSEFAKGASLYEEAASAWILLGRPVEAAESALEGLLARTGIPHFSPSALERQWAEIEAAHGGVGFAEHAPLAALVRGAVARLLGDDEKAKQALDDAVRLANAAERPEWTWQALDARSRLGFSQGGTILARKDTEAAIEILEAVASRLPRDLREVFWDDPRRKSLRQNYAAMGSFHGLSATGSEHRSTGHGTASLISLCRAPLPEDRLARVLEMTRELAREHDLGRLLTRITDHAIALVGAERGFVLLGDGVGGLHAEAARDRVGDDPHVSFSRSVTEKVILSGEPVVTVSARDDARLSAAVSVHQLMIQSIACVPIRSLEGRDFGEPSTIGALYVETRLRPGVRFAEELPTLGAFADQAAIAIENTRLITENRKRAEELLLANQELSAARDRLSELLGKKTEQLAVTRKHLERARQELGGHFGYGPMIGTSDSMRRLYALIERVKGTDVSVLVTGESGTGKELVARAIHDGSARAKGSFVAVNCGAIPQNLLESELFGAVRGAFTGADRTRLGLVREADGGTLLLDEIGELPLPMQSALLRVLQQRTVRPVGGDADIGVNVRVVASTHRNLEEMVRAGTFREDLFYRLHVVEVQVPPLRERPEDIAPLVAHFLSMFAARHRRDAKVLSRPALRKLSDYAWPGNVRQLEHVLLSAWLMSDDAEIDAGAFELPGAPARVSGEKERAEKGAKARPGSLSERKQAEREKILEALGKHNWNRAKTAEALGVPRRTFYRRLQEFEILGGE